MDLIYGICRIHKKTHEFVIYSISEGSISFSRLSNSQNYKEVWGVSLSFGILAVVDAVKYNKNNKKD